MTQAAVGQDVVDAWKNASSLVIANAKNRIRNLIVEIEDPVTFNHQWLQRYDPKSVGAKDRLSVVAKVLFPFKGKRPTENREQFYARWNNALERNRSKKNLHASWGTYFGRLTAFNGTQNQLENMIRALSQWRIRPEAALVAHLSAPTLDPIKPIGSPCLQYLEVLWGRDETIDLVAIYRNHDFLNKALGNYIGLGQLLGFIARESGKTPGQLVCHSVRAYCDEPGRLKTLIAK
jgi:thymidylate synthase